MSAFDSIALFLSHPLVLIGFVLVLVFGVHRTLLKTGIIPPLSQRSGSKIVQLLLRYGFRLALLIVLLGFALQFYKTSRETVDVEAIVHVLLEAQSKQLAQLGSAFEARHEKEIAAWKTLATQAVTALADMRERPDAPADVEEALRKLRQGDTGLAVQVFQEISEETTAPKNVRAQAYRNQGALIFFEDPARAAQAFRRAETLESGSVTEERSSPQWKPQNQEQASTQNDREIHRYLREPDRREHAREDTRETTAQAKQKPTATQSVQAPSTGDGLANTENNTASGSDTPAQGQTWPTMVEIPAGRFIMGGALLDRAKPLRRVTISQPFYLSATEVTFAQYDAFCSDTGCELHSDRGWGRGDRPVINVSWEDAWAYARWLGMVEGVQCRLPSEAEWEYAARAGTRTKYALPAPDGSDDIMGLGLANCANCGSEWDGKKTAPVGSFDPNAWGLYDMHGNVWEWVEDCWHNSYEGAPDDGSAWEKEAGEDCRSRVLRGGSWLSDQVFARAVYRYNDPPLYRSLSLGFRVVCSSPIR